MFATLFLVGMYLAAIGVALAIWAILSRWVRGPSFGQTVTLDNVTLFSKVYLLVGRPDRIVGKRRSLIPEEWKSSKEVKPWHVAQLGTYFILIEEHYGVRPRFGVIVLGDGRRKRIRNTNALRKRVLDVARRIPEARRELDSEIRVKPKSWQCRVCGQRSRCRQHR